MSITIFFLFIDVLFAAADRHDEGIAKVYLDFVGHCACGLERRGFRVWDLDGQLEVGEDDVTLVTTRVRLWKLLTSKASEAKRPSRSLPRGSSQVAEQLGAVVFHCRLIKRDAMSVASSCGC